MFIIVDQLFLPIILCCSGLNAIYIKICTTRSKHKQTMKRLMYTFNKTPESKFLYAMLEFHKYNFRYYMKIKQYRRSESCSMSYKYVHISIIRRKMLFRAIFKKIHYAWRKLSDVHALTIFRQLSNYHSVTASFTKIRKTIY